MEKLQKPQPPKRKLAPDDSLPRESEYYNMNNPRRGLAVVFNEQHFANPTYNRRGSHIDRDALQTIFTRLGFQVNIFNDLTIASITNTILQLSTQNFSDCDCFVMVFMSHGLKGSVLAYDGPLPIETLWDPFTGDQCPTLVNKPKLFFIQACEEIKNQAAVYVEVGSSNQPDDADEGDETEFGPTYTIPNRADFLVALSTIPGELSWRNHYTGTFFIQALCNNLNKYAYEKDIQSVLTLVNKRVSSDLKNCKIKRELCSKQLPTIISMLIRLLKFTKKYT